MKIVSVIACVLGLVLIPLFSPSAAKAASTDTIAYISSQANTRETVHVRNSDGTNDRLLFTTPTLNDVMSTIVLSSDGSRVAFNTNAPAIYVYNTADGTPVRQPFSGYDNLWDISPDGNTLLVDTSGTLRLVDISTGNETALPELNTIPNDFPSGFSPDGQSIIFAHYDSSSLKTSIQKYKLSDHSIATIRNAASNLLPTAVEATSYDNSIGYVLADPGDCQPADSRVMKIDGTGDTQLLDPTKDALPVFSPNGSKVLYRHSSTPLNGNCTYGAAIDGAWQGYVYGSGSNNSDIYVANRDGSSAQVAFSAVAYDWAGTQTSVIPSSTPVYRMANWMSHERLFTTDWNEVQTIKDKGGWVYEGLSFNAVSNSSIPVYRMANWKTHERLFTTDANEKDTIKDKGGWVYENIAFYADTSGTAVYRMANWKTQERLFTTDANERDAIKDKGGWVYEGVAFYAQ